MTNTNEKIYDAKEFYNKSMGKPSKANEAYVNFRLELETKYPELKEMGIYGIYADDKLVYIGKSETSICNRWIGHLWNASDKESKEHYRPMYSCLRYLMNCHKVEFKVLETTKEKGLVKYMEAYYINTYMPALNKELPEVSLKKGYKNIYLGEIKQVLEHIDVTKFKALKEELIKYKK